MPLGMALLAIGSAGLLIAHGLLAQRFYRAQAAKLGDETPDNVAPFGSGMRRGRTLWQSQADPELESLRRRATWAFYGFLGFAFVGGPILVGLSQQWPQVALPVAVPALGSTAGGSAMRWFALLSCGGFGAYYLWWLNVALSKGAEWRSGQPGDLVRWSRGDLILMCLLGLAVIPVVIAIVWLKTA
jgi:hypothetical protein